MNARSGKTEANTNILHAIYKTITVNTPWLMWGPRSRSDWWPALETCKGQLKPSEWWACSDQWSGLEAEIHKQLVRQTQHDGDTVRVAVPSDQNAGPVQCIPGRGAASEVSRSGWRPARECWPPDSCSRLSNVCQAEDWMVEIKKKITIIVFFSN